MDYALANQLVRKHKGALTRAKKKGPAAVVAAVDAFFDDFEDADLPLPDSWHTWNIARVEAVMELRRSRAAAF